MTDHVGRPGASARTARVAELHSQCDADYIKGQQERAAARPFAPYASLAMVATSHPVPEPTDLEVAISVGQQLLDSDQIVPLREALRLLLRALGAEPDGIDQ